MEESGRHSNRVEDNFRGQIYARNVDVIVRGTKGLLQNLLSKEHANVMANIRRNE